MEKISKKSLSFLLGLIFFSTIGFANNKGDIGETLKDLGSSRNIRGVAISMGTAGLTHGLEKVSFN